MTDREYFQSVIDEATAKIDEHLDQWKSYDGADREVVQLYIEKERATVDHFRRGLEHLDGTISSKNFMQVHAVYLLRQQLAYFKIQQAFENSRYCELYENDPEYRQNVDARIFEARSERLTLQSMFEQHRAMMQEPARMEGFDDEE